jgi:hypothetical protein
MLSAKESPHTWPIPPHHRNSKNALDRISRYDAPSRSFKAAFLGETPPLSGYRIDIWEIRDNFFMLRI